VFCILSFGDAYGDAYCPGCSHFALVYRVGTGLSDQYFGTLGRIRCWADSLD
jgi:hypothetical protein